MQPKYESTNPKDIAIILRKKGLMCSEIAQELNRPKSTVHGWIKNLKLSINEQNTINNRLLEFKQKRMLTLTKARQLKISERNNIIKSEVNEVIKRSKLSKYHKQLFCAVFFWCEGGKDTRAGFQFINSDPKMIETFLNLLRESFNVDESKFRALVHLHDYHDPNAQLLYWSNVTGIPLSQFHKPYLKAHTGINKRENYPGCVSIRYLDRQFGLRLQMLYNGFGDKYRGIVHRLV